MGSRLSFENLSVIIIVRRASSTEWVTFHDTIMIHAVVPMNPIERFLNFRAFVIPQRLFEDGCNSAAMLADESPRGRRLSHNSTRPYARTNVRAFETIRFLIRTMPVRIEFAIRKALPGSPQHGGTMCPGFRRSSSLGWRTRLRAKQPGSRGAVSSRKGSEYRRRIVKLPRGWADIHAEHGVTCITRDRF